ncbi:hypothetical protein Tco_0590758 [Tanacetum coccineum]
MMSDESILVDIDTAGNSQVKWEREKYLLEPKAEYFSKLKGDPKVAEARIISTINKEASFVGYEIVPMCNLLQYWREEYLDFIDGYGIPMCFGPLLPGTNQTVVDASVGYMTLFLSLFTIGDWSEYFNDLCLDVFEYFKCHFSDLILFEEPFDVNLRDRLLRYPIEVQTFLEPILCLADLAGS